MAPIVLSLGMTASACVALNWDFTEAAGGAAGHHATGGGGAGRGSSATGTGATGDSGGGKGTAASGGSGGAGAVCGNDKKDGSEDCDGTDLGGMTCSALGFEGGALSCGPSCTLDSSGCTCATNFCQDNGVGSGTYCKDATTAVSCTTSSTGACYLEASTTPCDGPCAGGSCQAHCGDGVRDFGEACEGTNFGGKSCADYSYNAGSLSCTSTCTINSAGCTCSQNACQTSAGTDTCNGSSAVACSKTGNCYTVSGSSDLACSATCLYLENVPAASGSYPTTKLFPMDHVGGNTDFSGNGPCVTVNVHNFSQPNSYSLCADIDVDMMECDAMLQPKSDYTHGTKHATVCGSSTKRFRRPAGVSSFSALNYTWTYRDPHLITDDIDMAPSLPSWISALGCSGDTSNEDLCVDQGLPGCSGCYVTFGCLQVLW